MTEMDVLDRLADAAASRRVPQGRDEALVLREASLVGRARLRARRQRARLAIGGGLALAAAVLLALWPRSASAPSLETLALGDHTVASTAGTTLSVDALETHASLTLTHGAALFDVAPLGSGRSFEVHTPDAVVRVVGTVFAVTVSNGRSRVDVFEGRVEVQRGTELEILMQGDSSGALELDERLRERGELLAAVRATRPHAIDVADTARSDEPSEPSEGLEAEHPSEVREAEHPSEEIEAEHPSEVLEVPSGGLEADIPSESASRRPPPITLAALRALCDRGAFTEALDAMGRSTAPRSEVGEWAMLEGDAARAVSDLPRAAAAYERAARALTPSRAALAGFLAASTRERLGQPEAALDVLDTTGASSSGSPLEERALAMRATLLSRLGRSSEAAESARRYLASFPGGEARAPMEALAGR